MLLFYWHEHTASSCPLNCLSCILKRFLKFWCVFKGCSISLPAARDSDGGYAPLLFLGSASGLSADAEFYTVLFDYTAQVTQHLHSTVLGGLMCDVHPLICSGAGWAVGPQRRRCPRVGARRRRLVDGGEGWGHWAGAWELPGEDVTLSFLHMVDLALMIH